MSVAELYDRDFFEWTQRNAELLRKGCLTEADIRHIAEEIADMGARDQREVRSYLIRLIKHLLKWQFQPERRYTQSGRSSWLSSVSGSRTELEGIFAQSPSLRRFAGGQIPSIYPKAVREASAETGIPIDRFPAECPYEFRQLLDENYFPE
jgi:hypothetical protein